MARITVKLPYRLAILAAALGPIKDQPARMVLSVLGIALGVALGVSIDLVNRSAVGEFARAVRSLSGHADLAVAGPATGMAEDIYPYLAKLPEVALASPEIEIEAHLPGRRDTLKLLGLDLFRAAPMSPLASGLGSGADAAVLDTDTIFLSPAAAGWLSLRPGDTLTVQAGMAPLALRVAGLLPAESYRQRLGVMDIGAAQWRFGFLGRISRVELRLKPGVSASAFRPRLQQRLPPGIEAIRPAAAEQRAASLSRAYRVNLDMLALVGLFTGAFLVFTTEALAVLRRRVQLAVLRVLGMTRRTLAGLLLAEAAMTGVAGSALGIALGYVTADLGLRYFGADLGGGYFEGVTHVSEVAPGALAGFFALGVGAAMLGALLPALECARTPPARALKPGDRERALAHMAGPWPGIAVLALGFAMTAFPARDGLPVFGYLAIALILVGAVLLMPAVAAKSFALLPVFRAAPLQIAAAQLRGAPGRAAIGMGTILVSFSLMVAMAVMVASFRESLEHWLRQILPADLYVRAAQTVESAFIDKQTQDRISALPGIARVDFLRSTDILLQPGRAPVTLVARPTAGREIGDILPLRETASSPSRSAPPAWISEALADLYGYRSGQTIRLPLAGRLVDFTVAGIWRDYARQSGAIVIDRGLYVRLSGDEQASSAALWLAPGNTADAIENRLRARLPGGAALEIARPGEIRARSLAIFDRSFAITYVLEAVAVVIGLFGVSSSFGAEALARRYEFAMLRHIGMSRREIGAMFGAEGALVSLLGVVAGMVLGMLIAVILIDVVNRQSFHWSMDFHAPWAFLLGLAATLLAAATATAIAAGRRATRGNPATTIREDW